MNNIEILWSQLRVVCSKNNFKNLEIDIQITNCDQ